MPIQSQRSEVEAYTTKDGSQIRELMHQDTHGNKLQSLAEAIVQSNQKTIKHLRIKSEELNRITQGQDLITLADETFPVVWAIQSVSRQIHYTVYPSTLFSPSGRGYL